MAKDLAWMHNGWSRNGHHSNDWVANTKDFVDHVFSLSLTGTVRCPYRRHENSIFLNKERVSLDLCQFEFMTGYVGFAMSRVKPKLQGSYHTRGFHIL
jgi:hypothetical protein